MTPTTWITGRAASIMQQMSPHWTAPDGRRYWLASRTQLDRATVGGSTSSWGVSPVISASDPISSCTAIDGDPPAPSV